MRKTSAHCSAVSGSRSATKPKKLRSAASRQLRVPMEIAALLLDVLKEGADFSAGEVLQAELSHSPMMTLGDKPQEQAPGIAVRSDRMARSIALFNQPFIEKRAQQRGKRIGLLHGCAPPATCKECAPKRRKRSPASWR